MGNPLYNPGDPPMMQHRTIRAQGGTVHYWIDKKENAESIVFTHGVTADHTMFEKQVSYFEKAYTLLLWDVPMHGRFPALSEFFLSRYR